MPILRIRDKAGNPTEIPAIQGADGHTPVKGVDYYTSEDKAEFKNFLAEELAKRGQLKPEFANSVAECTDTSKIYVLPDGNLYAYLLTEVVSSNYTNQVPISQSEDSTAVYNGTGYKDGAYLSGGSEGIKAGHTITGYIPYAITGGVKSPDIYIKGGQFDRIWMCDAGKTYKVQYNTTAAASVFETTQLDTNYIKLTPIVNTNGNTVIYDAQGQIGYIRLDLVGSGADVIVSIGQPIEENVTTTYQWADTGHAFVPADYESRILRLEEKVETLAPDSVDGVPSYVAQEAERVAQLVRSKRTAKSLVFAALSDVHYPYDDASDGDANTAQAMRHTGMGIAQIRRRTPLDFVGLFGDYVAGSKSATVEESKQALQFIHNAMYEAGLGVQQIWMQGNHDRNPYDTDDGDLTEDELYTYIFSHNTGTVVDSDHPQRGYGYKDFDAQKLRVIYWNSSDVSEIENVEDHCFSADQYRWMADTAFDFSDKAAPSEWGIVMLSHMPVNWNDKLQPFVDAYISGGSVTVTAADGVAVTVDFTGKDRAEFICAVNGHTHNFRYSQVGTNQFWQIAVPQVCAGRYNEYGTSWPEVGGELGNDGEPVYYKKTADSAESTSFCVFVVDRKNRKIHAVHYGAGIDREIDY